MSSGIAVPLILREAAELDSAMASRAPPRPQPPPAGRSALAQDEDAQMSEPARVRALAS